MSDRRSTPSNGRVAHVSLRGQVEAERFTEGEAMQVVGTVADLLAAPDGPRDRQLVTGEGFTVLEDRDGWCFGFAARDGYVGYIPRAALEPATQPTHRIAVARSYAKPTPDLKKTEPVTDLSFGSLLTVEGTKGAWSSVRLKGGTWWCPTTHLEPVDQVGTDPVAVAGKFLGTPYLWGGNSAFGIDCSGLIQAAMLACGVSCPGDSDLQASGPGESIGPGEERRRGDLYFWRGHVGILSDPDSLLHANAHHMAVVEEPLDEAIARIRKNGDGEVTARRRVSLRPGG